LDDLFGWLVERLPPGTSHVIAQSMGGVLAARLALERPERVARLVLVATSAGVDMARLGAAEWRHEYRALHPDRFLAARIPGARIVTVAGGTHSFASERAEEAASIIRSHLGQSNSNSN
jgi:pimeloyl-ACP methyl ester carboxylesterase